LTPNFTGVWKLVRGESDFAFLPTPRFRLDTIEHSEPQLRIVTHQIDSNGDLTVERSLTIGGPPVEIMLLGRPRMISARWDAEELLLETRSTVSGSERLIEDRWSLVPGDFPVQLVRVHHQPGGAVRQTLRFRAVQ